jgi:putative hemolysin
MKRMLLLILLLINQSFAAEVWKIGEQELKLVKCPEKFCMYLCADKDCHALKALKNPVKATLTEDGRNPGSEVCKKQGGEVSIAESKSGQLALCRFSDGSQISLDGLWVW